MGANPTQAYALIIFLAAFVLIAAGCAMDVNFLLILIGIAALVFSFVLFGRCKPWEHEER